MRGESLFSRTKYTGQSVADRSSPFAIPLRLQRGTDRTGVAYTGGFGIEEIAEAFLSNMETINKTAVPRQGEAAHGRDYYGVSAGI